MSERTAPHDVKASREDDRRRRLGAELRQNLARRKQKLRSAAGDVDAGRPGGPDRESVKVSEP